MNAAEEIGRLVTRILALAPEAGLYVSIKIEPAPDRLCQLCGGELGEGYDRYCAACCDAIPREAPASKKDPPCDRDGSGEAGQTAEQAGPVGRQPGPRETAASPK